MTLTPAYGRDYKSIKEVKKAWGENKDFIIQDIISPWCGSYVNKSDMQKDTLSQVSIRYSKLRKVCIVKVA